MKKNVCETPHQTYIDVKSRMECNGHHRIQRDKNGIPSHINRVKSKNFKYAFCCFYLATCNMRKRSTKSSQLQTSRNTNLLYFQKGVGCQITILHKARFHTMCTCALSNSSNMPHLCGRASALISGAAVFMTSPINRC